jgi:TatD DNase family protein
MFDSHCHLHSDRVGALAGELIARARAAGVHGFLLAGVDPDGWHDEDALAAAHADVFVSYGVHPQIVAELDDAATDAAVAALDRALARPPQRARLVAVGEIGLDAVGARKASLDRQERAFRAQLALARRHELPVALHVLDAHARALAVLADAGVPRAGGVVHSYSGSAELARDYLALGLHLSFAGPVANERARKTRAAAAVVPRERLLVETDAPDQTPAPHRPAPNEPAFLVAIVAALAQIRGEPDVAAFTDANARRLFRISEPA